MATARPDTEIVKNHAAFIWSVADLLRGDYKPYEYGKVIQPLTVGTAGLRTIYGRQTRAGRHSFPPIADCHQ